MKSISNNNIFATIVAFYLSKFNDLALKKLGYNTQKITECINNNKKYKEYFWKKSNKKL